MTRYKVQVKRIQTFEVIIPSDDDNKEDREVFQLALSCLDFREDDCIIGEAIEYKVER